MLAGVVKEDLLEEVIFNLKQKNSRKRLMCN